MFYTDDQLEKEAERYSNGVPVEDIDSASGEWEDGPFAWILDAVDDPRELLIRAEQEQISVGDLIAKAVREYMASPISNPAI